MSTEKTEKLKNQIWLTRISRINAEKRLINKEKFIQAVNIYYSCITIIFSFLSFIKKDDALSLITIFMSVSLLISIMHLNAQKYAEHAREFRDNYTQLQQLEFNLSHLTDDDDSEIKKVEEKYCKLMNEFNNHITYDYYCTLANSSPEFKKKNCNFISELNYICGRIWRALVQIIVLIIPIALYLIRGVIL